MKRFAAAFILAGMTGLIIPAPEARAQVNVTVSIGGFYDELSPYGEWVDCTYGECWAPRGVPAGWQPYTNGEWIYTKYGWTWASSDPWGGSPYHYGTWAFVGRHGWVWVPGTVWAPAWVTWSYSDSFVGWAPMPPTVTFGNAGYSGRAVVMSDTQYVFVPTNRFVGHNVASVRVEPGRNAEIFRQGKHVTRFDVSGGTLRNAALPMATVQKAMGRPIETREIGSAKTTPRTVSSGRIGKSGPVAIVAPARDVKAASASRQGGAPNAAPPQRQQPEQVNQQERGKAQKQQLEQAKPQQAKPAKQQEQAKPQPALQTRQQEPQPARQQPAQQQAKQQEPQQAKQQQAKQQPQAQQKAKQQEQQQVKQQQAQQQLVRQEQAQQEKAKPQQAPRQQEQARPPERQQQPRQPEQARQQEPPKQQEQRPEANPAARQQQAPAARPEQPGQGREKAMPPGQQGNDQNAEKKRQ